MKDVQRPASLSEKWEQSRQMVRRGSEADVERVMDLEVDVLTGPIHSLDDALAKLKAIELSFVEGERSDGADASALRQTIRWLRAQAKHCPPPS